MNNDNKKANRNNLKIYVVAGLAVVLTVALMVGVMLRQANSVPEENLNDVITEYENEAYKVKVAKVEPINNSAQAKGLWLDFSNFDIKENCDLVFKGRILETNEICINYVRKSDKEYNVRSGYCTLLNVEVEDVYYASDSYDWTNTITVYSEISSRNLYEDAKEIPVEGSEYYFFVQNSKKCTSPFGYDRFCDYMIKTPPTTDYFVKAGGTIKPMMAEMLRFNCSYKDKSFIKVGGDLETALKKLFNKQ